MEAGGRRATAVHVACRGVLVCRLGAEHGEERTLNMMAMSVTLEVSKLSGWLNTVADCRESKGRAYGAGRGCGPADGGDGVQRAGEGSTADWGQNRRGAHLEHALHARDAGGIPV